MTMIPIGSLRGPAGAPGADGANGADGADGAPGAPGAPGSSYGYYYPEDHGAVGYPTNDNAAIQAAIDAASAAGGGTVILSKLYGGGNGDITQKNNVNVQGPGITGPAASTAGIKAIAGATTFRYRWGNSVGNPYPGTIKDLNIDGDFIAGVGQEIFRAEAVETSAYDLHVMNAVDCCVDLASSQNLNFVNPNFGSCTEGVALRVRAKAAGAQPPGHCVFFGGHIGDSKRSILVTSHDATFFVGPHDNYFIGTIIETGRSAYDIDDIVSLEDGDTHFLNCVFTIGAQVTAINNDCSIRVINSIRTATSTTAVFSDCSFGGGAGAVKATYGVRVIGAAGRVSNAVNYALRRVFANVTYAHVHDGADGLITAEGPYIPATAVTDEFTAINTGTLVGVLRQTRVPFRFLARSDTGSPLQVRRDTDTVANRWQMDRDGKQSWLDGAAGAIRGYLQRVLAGTQHFMTMGGIWVFGNGMGRVVTTTNFAVDAALAIDSELVSHQLINFTANGADVTALTLSNGYSGAELRISIFGTGVNTIAWPADVAGGIHPMRTLPQPIDGQIQFIDLNFLNDRWYEVNRSVRRGEKIINAQTANYVAALADSEPDRLITMTVAGANTLTIPPNVFPVGATIDMAQLGAGQTTLTPGAGVTINGTPGLKIAAQYGGATLVQTAANVWWATGKLSA